MRIIIANYRFFIAGGPEKYMFKFIDAASKRGIDVIPFSVQNPNNFESPYSKYFAKPRSTELLYKDTKKSIRNLWGMVRATVWNTDAAHRLKRLIHDTKPDVVFILHEVNHLSPSIIRAAKKQNVRVVHRISDFFMFCAKYDFLCGDEICEACIGGDYKKALKERCVKGSFGGTWLRVMAMKLYRIKRVYDDVDQYICTCEFSKKKLVEGGIPESKISCVNTFVDVDSIVPCYENQHYFLFLGRMAHQKGAIYAVEAMKLIKNKNYKLKITGEISDSIEDQHMWNYIKNNNLEEVVEFTGFKSGRELETLISGATCVVCPAIWYENMPNTVIEAYAYGKPVVASNIGSLSEIVEDGQTGLLFEMKNSTDLAEKLSILVEDETKAIEMGKKARSVCENKYCEEVHMSKVLSILSNSGSK